MVIMNSIAYIIPWGIGYVWDHVFPRLQERGGLVLLAKWCGILVFLALMRASCIFLMIYCYWTTGTKVVQDLRNALYLKLQYLPFRFYDSARTGDLMSRLTLDIELIRNFYAFMFEHRSQIVMYFSIVSVLLFITDWKLALVCLAVTPFAVAMILNFSEKTRQAVIQRQQQAGVLNSMVQENIVGIRVVKAFAMEDVEFQKFQTENRAMLRCNLGVSRLQVILHPFLVFCSTLGVVAILWYGGIRVASGSLTIGKFISFMSYLAVLNWPLWILAPNTNQLRQAEGSAQRLLELLNQPETITSPDMGGLILEHLQGRIAFEHVTFSYDNSGQPDLEPVLKEVNLTVNAGEKVAILGLTGAGKSTLINLIPRFYDPQEGVITVDGVDVRTLNLDWWRRQVGLVLQETFLFSTTIYNNITFGRPDATLEAVRRAAQAAQIDEFILSLPEGYETIVGERGMGLSGGQKQRIAIARALLLNPMLLILDDSTSSVDVETEHAIQESLQHFIAGRTTLVITQRLSTARLADRIILLDSGEIRAQGNHEELLDQDDFYRQLYQIQQFKDEQPAESA
jgi:ABC-type multidrug transport system fused ATPase/permease subunit